MKFLILVCLSFPLMAFEGYDLSDPYPETNMDDWNRVQEQRREDLRDLYEYRYDNGYDDRYDNDNPHRFEIDWED